jgi:hypothetical protein
MGREPNPSNEWLSFCHNVTYLSELTPRASILAGAYISNNVQTKGIFEGIDTPGVSNPAGLLFSHIHYHRSTVEVQQKLGISRIEVK